MNDAVAFLTCLGRARAPRRRAAAWFPLVGALMGLALGGWWSLARREWPAGVAAALVVVADLVITGMLHFDGLADAADGLLPHLDRERRLAVIREAQAGAFAVTVVMAALLLRWAALDAMRPRPLLLAGLWCASRSLMAVTLSTAPYARAEGGLASAFLGDRVTLVAGLVGLAGGGALAGAQLHVGGPGAVVGVVAGYSAVLVLGLRRLGGFTGDVLGAAAVVGETVGLLVAAGRW